MIDEINSEGEIDIDEKKLYLPESYAPYTFYDITEARIAYKAQIAGAKGVLVLYEKQHQVVPYYVHAAKLHKQMLYKNNQNAYSSYSSEDLSAYSKNNAERYNQGSSKE